MTCHIYKIVISLSLGPDRKPHPSALEAKALQANILFSLSYSPSGDLSIAVRNKRSHTDLSDVLITVGCYSDICDRGFEAPPVKIGIADNITLNDIIFNKIVYDCIILYMLHGRSLLWKKKCC